MPGLNISDIRTAVRGSDKQPSTITRLKTTKPMMMQLRNRRHPDRSQVQKFRDQSPNPKFATIRMQSERHRVV